MNIFTQFEKHSEQRTAEASQNNRRNRKIYKKGHLSYFGQKFKT